MARRAVIFSRGTKQVPRYFVAWIMAKVCTQAIHAADELTQRRLRSASHRGECQNLPDTPETTLIVEHRHTEEMLLLAKVV
jgi:hypothetical protein